MSLLIIHLILMSKPPVSCRTPHSSTALSSKAAGFGEYLREALWALAGTADLLQLRKGQTSGSVPVELHHILHVESREAWPGSGLDVPAEDNSIQCSMARPGKWFLAGTVWKLSSGPFQQALIGEASLIVTNTFSCCLMVSLCIWQFFYPSYCFY